MTPIRQGDTNFVGNADFSAATAVKFGTTISGNDPVFNTVPVEYWNAYDISGLAEGANVTTWTGRNGNVANLTAAQAIFAGYAAGIYSSGGICGHPSMHCAGSSVLATSSNLVTGSYGNFSVMAVLWPKSTTNGIAPDFIFGVGSSGSNRILGGMALGANAAAEFEIINQGAGCPGTKHRISAGNIPGSARPFVCFYTFDGSKTLNSAQGVSSLWVDGVCVDALGNGVTTQAISGQVLLGNLSPGDGFIFELSALAFWTRTIQPSEIRRMNAYLEESFLKDYRPRCFVTGDSIAEGTVQDAGGTIVDQLQKAFPQVRFINAARGGSLMQTQASGASPYDNLLNSLRSGDVVLMFPASNDISQSGTAVATVEGYQTTLVTAAHAQGAFVVQTTMIPIQANVDNISQATSDANRATYNTWLNLAANSGANAKVDLTLITGFTSNTDWQSVTNYTTIVNSITGTNATGGTQTIALPNFAAHNSRVASVIKNSDLSDVSSDFESTLSADGNIKQTSGNLAGAALTVTINDGRHPRTIATASWVSPILTALKPFFTA